MWLNIEEILLTMIVFLLRLLLYLLNPSYLYVLVCLSTSYTLYLRLLFIFALYCLVFLHHNVAFCCE